MPLLQNIKTAPAHVDLTDMPSAIVADHDGRYYTETEVDNLLTALTHNGLFDMPSAVNSDHDGRYFTETELTDNSTALNLLSLTDGTALLTLGSLTGVKLGSLVTNGFVKTSGGDGTLSVDTNTYLTEAGSDALYLKLDASNDPVTGQLDMSNHIVPTTTATYDLGDSSNFWRTLYLENDGGNVVLCRAVQSGGGPTNYTFNCGGGFFPSEQNQGGTFTFKMNDIGGALGTSVNQMIFDVGSVDFAAAAATNDIILQSFNGISTWGFVCAFGGFNNPEYGFQLRRITGAEATGKTFVFDNQVPNSDFRRSIDFRINSVDILTIENDNTIDMPFGLITAPGLLSVTAPTGLQVNGYGALTSSTVFGLLDVFTVKATTTNVPVTFGMRPDGTNDSSLIFVTNSSDTTNYGVLEGSVDGTIAQLVTWRINAGTGPTVLNIGEKVSNFIGVGTCDSLTTIDFYFANAIEMQLQPDTIIFNNGAVDTQIDWTTSGEMGLQVATNDIIRISATQAQCFQDFLVPSDTKKIFLGASQDMSIEYGGTVGLIDTSLQNASDLQIDCGTDKTIELQETVWDDLRIPGLSVTANPSASPTLGAFLGAGSLQVWRFTGTGVLTEEVFFTIQLPHKYKEGTDIIPHVHWTPTDANAGDVVWQLEYTWQNINGTFGASTTITVTDSTNTTAWEHLVASFSAITGTNMDISSILVCRLFRDPAHGSDTYTSDAAFLEIDFHFEIDTIGSRQPFVK